MNVDVRYPLDTWYNKESSLPIGDRIFRLLLEDIPLESQASFLSPDLKNIPSPDTLKGIAEGVALFLDKIYKKEKILIVGDYDVDGITSTTLFSRFMSKIKHPDFERFIPSRFKHGYGLTQKTVDEVLKKKPALVITVDNGITAQEEAERLKQAGIEVIITDHHLPQPHKIPQCIVINPRQEDCAFPDKNLSGVGVAFMFLLALRKQLRNDEFFTDEIREPNLLEDLDLVAMGSIADQVPMIGLNRTLTHHGLQQMEQQRQGKGKRFYPYLLEFFSQRASAFINSEVIGFQLAPLLNATGRMVDAMEGVDFLLSPHRSQAAQAYNRLHKLNLERREKEKEMSEVAFQAAEPLVNRDEKGIMIYDEGFHEGIIGIVASRTVDKFGLPTVLFSPCGGGYLKGSCRSIPGVNMVEILKACDSLLLTYGGHAGAAGCSVDEEKLPELQALFQEVCLEKVPEERPPLNPAKVELLPWMITWDTYNSLLKLEPHGQENRKPVFLLRNIPLMPPRIMSEKHLKWELTPDIEMVFWNAANQVPEVETYNITFTLQKNTFRGKTKIQLNAKSVTP